MTALSARHNRTSCFPSKLCQGERRKWQAGQFNANSLNFVCFWNKQWCRLQTQMSSSSYANIFSNFKVRNKTCAYCWKKVLLPEQQSPAWGSFKAQKAYWHTSNVVSFRPHRVLTSCFAVYAHCRSATGGWGGAEAQSLTGSWGTAASYLV